MGKIFKHLTKRTSQMVDVLRIGQFEGQHSSELVQTVLFHVSVGFRRAFRMATVIAVHFQVGIYTTSRPPPHQPAFYRTYCPLSRPKGRCEEICDPSFSSSLTLFHPLQLIIALLTLHSEATPGIQVEGKDIDRNLFNPCTFFSSFSKFGWGEDQKIYK